MVLVLLHRQMEVLKKFLRLAMWLLKIMWKSAPMQQLTGQQLAPLLLKSGAKLDNLIQVAHNVEVGHNTVIAAQAGVSGSTKIGNNVMIGGQAGIVGHIQIADGSKINAQSGVSKSIKSPNTALPVHLHMIIQCVAQPGI